MNIFNLLIKATIVFFVVIKSFLFGISDVKLFSLIQDWRKEQGLNKYVEDKRLCKIAEDRVNDGEDNHVGFLKKMKDNYYKDILNVNKQIHISENLTGGLSPQDALNNWLDSSPHRKALETDYKFTCVRCKKMYCVQIFSNFE